MAAGNSTPYKVTSVTALESGRYSVWLEPPRLASAAGQTYTQLNHFVSLHLPSAEAAAAFKPGDTFRLVKDGEA